MKRIIITIPDKAEQYVFNALADNRVMPPGIDLIVQDGYNPDELVLKALSGLGNWCLDSIKSNIEREEYKRAIEAFGQARTKQELDNFNSYLASAIEAELTAAIMELSIDARVQIKIEEQ